MIIKKMTASFGCLENETMTLHEGLNIITAPNESGKSTWCAFIRAMLYGIDSSQREKGGVKPDKVKFAPWSGAAMAGEMDIEYEGRDITLRRSTKTASAPMREFSATYTGSGEKVSGLTGKDVGEELTGMPKAVFESSVFVRQAGLAVYNSAELEKRINAIISSGEDEGISYTDADAALRAWQRKRRHNSSGAIPAVEAEIAEKQRALAAMERAAEQREAMEKRLSAAVAAQAQAEENALERSQQRRRQLMERLQSLHSDNEQAEQAAAHAREQAIRLRAETEKGPFGGKSAAEAKKEAESEAETLRALHAAVPKPTMAIALWLAGIAAIIISFFTHLLVQIPGIILLMAGAILLILRRSKRCEAAAYALSMAHRYGNPDPDSIVEKAAAHAAACVAAEKAEAEAQHAKAAAEFGRSALREAEAELLSHSGESTAPTYDGTALIREQLAALQGRAEALGDPMVINSEKYALNQHLSELQGQYDALSLAISTLREANEEMQQRFSPRLGQRAGEIMHLLTGGKYQRLSFSRSLAAAAKRQADTVDHDCDFLSAGTADQLYLALRLAICELALPEDKSCPLVLDDALVNFDTERMGYALDALQEIAGTRQVILFTCHDREEKYINKMLT